MIHLSLYIRYNCSAKSLHFRQTILVREGLRQDIEKLLQHQSCSCYENPGITQLKHVSTSLRSEILSAKAIWRLIDNLLFLSLQHELKCITEKHWVTRKTQNFKAKCKNKVYSLYARECKTFHNWGCFKISFFTLTEVGSEQNITGYYKKQVEQQAVIVEGCIKKGNDCTNINIFCPSFKLKMQSL